MCFFWWFDSISCLTLAFTYLIYKSTRRDLCNTLSCSNELLISITLVKNAVWTMYAENSLFSLLSIPCLLAMSMPIKNLWFKLGTIPELYCNIFDLFLPINVFLLIYGEIPLMPELIGSIESLPPILTSFWLESCIFLNIMPVTGVSRICGTLIFICSWIK